MSGCRSSRAREHGAALLSAVLMVALIASLAATVLWQQWRLTEVERHERTRQQGLWLLHGALDWARLILREDARSGGADHLGEPWATVLQESRLSSFLASDGSAGDLGELSSVFLSGRIEDLQGRLNLSNLLDGDKVSEPDVQMAERLFDLLDLPAVQARQLALALQQAKAGATPTHTQATAFLPQRVEQLVWLGLPTQTLSRLAPYISLLPERTPLNLNTAGAEVLSASLKDLPLGQARRLVQARERQHWRDLEAANGDLGKPAAFQPQRHALSSRYFLITGQLRQDDQQIRQQALVRRDGLDIRVVWQQASNQLLGAPADPPPR